MMRHAKQAAEDALLDQHITWAEDECTEMAKTSSDCMRRRAIDKAHESALGLRAGRATSVIQHGRNAGYALSTTMRRAIQCVVRAEKHV